MQCNHKIYILRRICKIYQTGFSINLRILQYYDKFNSYFLHSCFFYVIHTFPILPSSLRENLRKPIHKNREWWYICNIRNISILFKNYVARLVCRPMNKIITIYGIHTVQELHQFHLGLSLLSASLSISFFLFLYRFIIGYLHSIHRCAMLFYVSEMKYRNISYIFRLDPERICK